MSDVYKENYELMARSKKEAKELVEGVTGKTFRFQFSR